MRAIVGLGNPGAAYARTRHNAGFVLVDLLAERWAFPRFRRDGQSRLSLGYVDEVPVALLKPQTMMNRSGAALRPLLDDATFLPGRDLLIVVDEVALDIGTFRFRPRGSAGGHNGLKSIEGVLRSQDYARLRIGVGPRPEPLGLSDFVLDEFTDEEWRTLEPLWDTMVDAVTCWVTDGIDDAMNRFNRVGKPQ